MIDRPRWASEELQQARTEAESVFRQKRLQETLEVYLDFFDHYMAIFEDLIERTVGLTELEENALALLSSKETLAAMRYLTGPPISEDDLKIVTEASLSRTALSRDPEMVQRVLEVLRDRIDRRRFPWFSQRREATEAERHAATVASAALIAAQRTATHRRSESSQEQESQVEEMLLRMSFAEVERRKVLTISDVPGPGTFCRESELGNRKADFLIGLFDGRCMPVECKVSNSSTNSVKRLNNDAAAKAKYWQEEFGNSNVVPVAVLSGVYKLKNLLAAQRSGLAIFWAHQLDELTNWIDQTKA